MLWYCFILYISIIIKLQTRSQGHKSNQMKNITIKAVTILAISTITICVLSLVSQIITNPALFDALK